MLVTFLIVHVISYSSSSFLALLFISSRIFFQSSTGGWKPPTHTTAQ